jgi:hypothetical protein
MVSERIAVEDRIECRDGHGHRCVLLRWRRQHDEGEGLKARWVSFGPALFTLADGSAVIQTGGSTLQVVATGRLLTVIDPHDADMPVLTDEVSPTPVAEQAAMRRFLGAAA